MRTEIYYSRFSMPRVRFSRGQARNTAAVIGDASYLTKPGVLRRQLEPVESHLERGHCTRHHRLSHR